MAVLFEVIIDGSVLYATMPQELSGVISHKPASIGDVLTGVGDPIQLLHADGRPGGYRLGPSRHWPAGPRVC